MYPLGLKESVYKAIRAVWIKIPETSFTLEADFFTCPLCQGVILSDEQSNSLASQLIKRVLHQNI